jgi:hypothetical protein
VFYAIRYQNSVTAIQTIPELNKILSERLFAIHETRFSFLCFFHRPFQPLKTACPTPFEKLKTSCNTALPLQNSVEQ